MQKYKPNSITLIGAISLGTGVMIGAGIFALIGQVADLAGSLFPVSFVVGGIITAFTAYSYVKMSNAYPSAGGIAMFLVKIYGRGVIAGTASLLMAFSMIINESLVARTFGTYTLQLFDAEQGSFLIPLLGVILLAFAFAINISSNRIIGTFSSIMSLLKITGIAILAIVGLWIANFSFVRVVEGASVSGSDMGGFLASIALTILAFKGFTTITNSGSEIINPHLNVGRAIVISISICAVIYFLVAWSVAGNLTLTEIIQAKDYALAEAAKPAFGSYGLWATVVLAIIATISGVIASVFAVSRMLAMLTDMHLIPHRHFGMPGTIQKHTLVYTIIIAMVLTIFFDLSRIASLGAIFYLVMDIAIHWGILLHLRDDIKANSYILTTAILLDIVILGAFLWIKSSTDIMITFLSIALILLIIGGEWIFLRPKPSGR